MTKERMTKDEALKLAMEGLEDPLAPTKRLKAITAIKEVVAQQEQDEKFCDANCVWTDHHPDCKLAQPEQEPVAWMHIENYIDEDNLWDSRKLFRDYDNGFGVPLYTAPPTWVGLTDEEKLVANQMWRVMDADGFIQAIETKLKQKNGFAEEKNT